ncbi:MULTISPECIES: aspartyl-phosphate phosphatase Spo0E family protein [Virgibacillus]|uniref:Spo0E like sporulation regulatory protein n=1 Tax=Virgibacillus dokdonensis TaxID=302167 RepID=A0A2K9IWR7_9BACI|nr:MULTISPECIES: aspartyl-phosphate phosphatase Spo0E family protein [Virgibacillus]AUJ24202.1 Spo0E like sporulation regulatory protein [Virgibacillus dokdonensis]
MSNSNLLERIEMKREKMLSLSNSHALTSEAVINSSVELDALILEYVTTTNYNRKNFKKRLQKNDTSSYDY